MLLICLIIYICYILINNHKVGYKLFVSTLIVSIFFFSSKDFIIGMPLYFYFMLISTFVSFRNKKESFRINKNMIIFGLILVTMIVQILFISLGTFISDSLLINQSNTDLVDISDQFFKPHLNFTIIKHFIFYFMYLLFLIANYDYISNKFLISNISNILLKCFKILFICILIEFVIVNLLKGYNDRQFMIYLFNINNNQITNYNEYGHYTVCLSFSERSEMVIILVYFFIRMSNKSFNGNEFLWDILGGAACFATGSTTALLVCAIYFIWLLIVYLIEQKNRAKTYFAIFLFILVIVIAIESNRISFGKFNEFIKPSIEYGSAFFRNRSIKYGIKSFLKSPLLGQGIGTVYCHSGLIQTLANIGIIGLVLMYILYRNILVRKFSLLKMLILICISYGAFIIEQVTSPYFLVVFISLLKKYSLNNTNIS